MESVQWKCKNLICFVSDTLTPSEWATLLYIHTLNAGPRRADVYRTTHSAKLETWWDYIRQRHYILYIVHSLGVISLFLLCCVGPPLKVIGGGETIREDMVDIDSLTHWTIYTSPHFRNRSGDLRWMCDSLIYIYLSIRCGIFSSTLLLCQRKKREPKVNIKATGLHNSVVCILFVS